MIFKNNNEVKIKNLAAEIPKAEIDPESPIDYRLEISAAEKAQIPVIRQNQYPWINYEQDACLKHLGIELPPHDKTSRDNLITTMDNRIRNATIGLDYLNRDYAEEILMMVLFNRKLYEQLPPDTKGLLEQKLFAVSQRDSLRTAWVDLALLHVLKPEYKIDPSKMRVLVTDAGAYSKIWASAYARIAGFDAPFKLTGKDWVELRKRIYDDRLLLDQTAKILFFARIVNAKDVRVDTDGLHIVDNELPPMPQPDTPLPPRTRI